MTCGETVILRSWFACSARPPLKPLFYGGGPLAFPFASKSAAVIDAPLQGTALVSFVSYINNSQSTIPYLFYERGDPPELVPSHAGSGLSGGEG